MFNNKLQYMLDNNPEKTLSVKGSEVRKKIRPFFFNILKLGNKLRLIVEKKEFKVVDRPIIYVASHGFKDDVLNTVLTLKDDAYVVFGNIDLFFNTFDGLCLWIYGSQLVDRYDKESKHAMKEKMDRVLKLKNNVIIFSEATWNLSPNKLMEKLHWGFYDVALKNDALIVPVVTHKVGKKCYSRVLESIDLKNLSEEDLEDIIFVMKKYINKASDLMIYNDSKLQKIKTYVDELKDVINSYYESRPFNKSGIDKIEELANEYYKLIKMENIDYLDEVKKQSINLIAYLISRISFATKESMVIKIRDIMATEKYDIIDKHPDYSYMKNNTDMYEAWNSYIKDTITATPYFYLEQEKTTTFRDPLIKDEVEVMPWIKRLNK